MSDIKRTGAAGGAGTNGTAGSPNGTAGYAGYYANATNYGTIDLTNSAEAYGGQGGAGGAGFGAASGSPGAGGAGGSAYAGATTTLCSTSGIYASAKAAGGAGGLAGAPYSAAAGAGGDSRASATANNTGTGDATATVAAIGGNGGNALFSQTPGYFYGNFGGAGGAATAQATAYAPCGTASATANATGGAGANGIIGGAGGVASGATAFASGYNASATVNQTGGNGGTGLVAGAGANSTLVNAVSGATTGGSLTLMQTATGGRSGASGDLYVGLEGGSGSSTLGFNDTTASVLTGTVDGAGGNGGYGAQTGGAGGAGIASITLSGAHAVYATAVAHGGDGGASGRLYGNAIIGGGAGGSAQANATAQSSSANGTASATAIAIGGTSKQSTSIGGAGGSVRNVSAAATGYNASASAQAVGGAGGPGVYGGAGGIASGTTATASGFNASASVSQTGGAGGGGILGGATGVASSLDNAASAAAAGGRLMLSQTATGGAGGATYRSGGEGAAGGAGRSTLHVSDTAARVLIGTAAANGGEGGFSDAGGSGGSAAATIALSGANAVYATANAVGGAGGYAIFTGSTGGYAGAIAAATSTGIGAGATAQATANASGGAGRSGRTTNGMRGGGNSTATASTVDGQLALANATGNGSSGRADATAQTAGDGPITAVSSVADAQFGVAAVDAESAAQSGAVLGFGSNTDNAYAFATEAPNANYVFQVLSSNPDLGSLFSSGSVFAAGSQGTLSANDITAPHDYRSTTDWTIDTTALSGELILGLIDNKGFGTGPAALEFSVTVGGSTIVDQTFTSIAAAEGFFNDAAIDLGPVVATAALHVDVTFDLKTSAADVGLGAEFLLGTTAEAPPPLVSGAGNTVFWTESDPPVAIDSALTLSHLGGSTVAGATVSISSGYLSGDILSFTAPSGSGITGSISGGTLTLSGTASVAAYEAALDSVTFSSTSLDPTESGADSQRIVTWQVQGTTVSSAIDVGQIYSLTTGVDTINAGAGNDIINAAGDTLTAGDIIDGGGGNNELIFRGAGQFDLSAPATFANIQTVVAQEGQAGSPGFTAQDETVFGRAGTTLTLTVEANPAPNAGNPNPSAITINEADNSDTVNLGPGTDIIAVGGNGETINSGGGSDTFIVNRNTIGATINASSSLQDLLEVTGGGVMTMGNAITNVFQVNLLPAATDYDFTTAAVFSLNVDDLSTTTNDTLRAGAGFQIFTGGGAGRVTFVASPTGQDIYEDTAELFNGDSLVNFDLGVNPLAFTDIDPTTAQLGYTQDNASSGTLTVSDGTHSASLTLFGQFAVTGFELLADGTATVVAYVPPPALPSQTVGGPYSGNENTAIALGGLSVSVSQRPEDPLSTVLSVADGTISVGSAAGVTVTGNGTGTVTLAGTATAIDSALLGATYTGATNFYGSDALSMVTTDTADRKSAGAGTAMIAVLDTSAPSQTVGGPYSGNENTVIALGGLSVSVSPNTDDPLSTVLSVADGTISIASTMCLTATGNGTGMLTLAGTAMAIDGALSGLTYTAATDFYGSDTLSVVTTDTVDGNGVASTAAITVLDTSVPSETVGGPYSGGESTAIALGGLSVSVSPNANDPLSTVLSVADGAISVGSASGLTVTGNGTATLTLAGTATAIDSALSGATYTAAQFYGSDTLSMTTTDTVDGNSIGAETAAIAVADTATIGENLPATLTGTFGSPVSLAGITVSDNPNTGDTLTSLLKVADGTITVAAPGGAGVTGNGTATVMLTGTAAAINSALASAAYSPAAANSARTDTLSMTTTDPGGRSSGTQTATITDDLPSGPDLGLSLGAGPAGAVNTTDVATPVFTGVAQPFSVILLYDDGKSVGRGLSDAQGQWTAASSVRLPAGTHEITATSVNPAGEASTSAATTITEITGKTFDGAGPAQNVNFQAGNGNHTMQWSNGVGAAIGGNGNNTATAGDGRDTVVLGNGSNTIALGNGNDVVTLGNGSNTITLGSGSDTVSTGNGSNRITMAGGTYAVTVGNGSDALIFTVPAGELTMAFGRNDELVFRNSGFDLGVDDGKGKTTPQQIAASLFSTNTNGTFATTGNRLAYNPSTGDLYYDAQGSTPGSTSYLVADLTNKPHLTSADLFFTS